VPPHGNGLLVVDADENLSPALPLMLIQQWLCFASLFLVACLV
jgi:hypothetical protein